MQPYDGDILEHALNKGLTSAATRYQVPIEQVRELVVQFSGEIENELRCPCEVSRDNGRVMLCFACTGPIGERIKLGCPAG